MARRWAGVAVLKASAGLRRLNANKQLPLLKSARGSQGMSGFAERASWQNRQGATRFCFDPRLTPLDAGPPERFFADHNGPEQSGGAGQVHRLGTP